eukprot:6270994-Prymnesium_polylepis.1
MVRNSTRADATGASRPKPATGRAGRTASSCRASECAPRSATPAPTRSMASAPLRDPTNDRPARSRTDSRALARL